MKLSAWARQRRVPLLRVFSALTAFVGVVTLLLTLEGESQAYRFAWLPVFCLLLVATQRFLKDVGRPLMRRAGVLALFFCFFFFLGYRLTLHETLGGIKTVFLLALAACSLAPGFGWLFSRGFSLCERLAQCPDTSKGCEKRTFLFYFLVVFMGWFAVFLAYYPGLFAYDVPGQITETLSAEYTNYNPIFHTLLLGDFYTLGGAVLGSYNAGIALYTLFQMIVMALILAYSLVYLRRLGTARVLRGICLVFYAAFPICSVLGISVTKDTLFSGLFLLLAVHLHQALTTPDLLKSPRFLLRLVPTVAVFCLLRNNGILVVLFATLAGLFLFAGKTARLRFMAIMAAGLLLFGAVSFSLISAFDAKAGKVKEVLSIPLQQVARVYALHKDQLAEAQEVEQYMPRAFDYHPKMADYVKFDAIVTNENVQAFLALWKNVAKRYPLEYVDAFLLCNIGYWYVDDLSHSRIYGTGLDNRQGYLLTDTKPDFGVTHETKLAPLEFLYERLFSINWYQIVPVAASLFAPAFFLWALCFLTTYAGYAKNKAALLVSLLCFGLLPSLLLGPCAIIRYAFPLVLLCPFLFGLVFHKGIEPEKRIATGRS